MDPGTLVIVLLISWAAMRGGGAARADSRNYRERALSDLRRDQPGHSDRWYRRHTMWRWLGRMGHEVAEGLPTLRSHVTEDAAYARLGYAQARAGHHNRLRDLRRLLAEAKEEADKARKAAEREQAEREAARTAPPGGRHAAEAPAPAAPPADSSGAGSVPPAAPSERNEKDGQPSGSQPPVPPAAADARQPLRDPAVPVAPPPPAAPAGGTGDRRDVFDEAPRDAIDELTDNVPVDAPPAPREEPADADPPSPRAGAVDPFGAAPERPVSPSEIRTIADLRDFTATRSTRASAIAEEMEDAQAVVAVTAQMNDPAIAGPIGVAAAEARAMSDALAGALAAARSHAQGEEYVESKGVPAAAAAEFLAPSGG